jgi:lipoprotein-anchoring transpeptidase ErfK/SrfK
MRTAMRTMMLLAAMAVGVGAAGAQIVDPNTGFTVDAANDPVDFSAVASGQPGNAGMEAAASAMAAVEAASAAAMQASQDAANAAMSSANNDDSAEVVPAAPPVPKTAKPVIAPKGGTFAGSVQVSITDADAQAVVFYTTDGKKPTTSSARYAGPITVTGKTKVQAVAFDVSDMPSGVVGTTYKVKAG